MLNLLFICSKNQLRSPTAETVFSNLEGVEAISAGTNTDSETPVSGDLIEWADIILVMEPKHKKKISSKYQKLLKGKKLVSLDIPDNYKFMQPELVELLKRKVSAHIPGKN